MQGIHNHFLSEQISNMYEGKQTSYTAHHKKIHFSNSSWTYWDMWWPGKTVQTSSVQSKHNSGIPYSNWKLHPVRAFLQATDSTETMTTGRICICSCGILQASKYTTSRGKTLHITTHLEVENVTGSKGWTDRFKGRNNIIFTTLVSENGNTDSKTDDDWKKTSVTYIMLIRQANFLIKNVVKSLTFYCNPCHEGT